MKFLYRPILLTMILAAIALFFAVVFVPTRTLIQLGNYTLIWISAATTIAYVAGFLSAVTSRKPSALDFLTVGVVLSWLAVFMNRQWAQGLRSFPDAEWMRTSWVIPAYVLIGIMAGAFHLVAGGSIDGKIPRRNWVWLGLVIGGGLATTAFIVGMGWGEAGLY